jgi:phage terminase large subunit-like protein
MKNQQPKPLTRGQRVIAFIERFCVVPEGDLMGQPVVLLQFQKDFIIDVYDNPFITDTAILSIARKNAKTALIAFIVLAHLVGPEAVENSRIVSGAMSKEQAAEVFNLASKTINLSPKLRDRIKIIPSGKKLIGLKMNVEYQATSADAKTAHGKSPIVAILDEVGQVKGPQSDFIDAITTAQGAYKNALLFYISTQAQNNGDLLSILIDDYETNKPEKMVCHVHCADADADVMDEKQWKKANPALGIFRSEADMRKQADKANRMPTFTNTFKNLNLNMRVTTSSPFVTQEIWKKSGANPPPISECINITGGLDLSGKTDLTAMVLQGYHPETNSFPVYSYFWTPLENLIERAKRDRAPYDVWYQQGYIEACPGHTIDYEFVALRMAQILKDVDIVAMGYDRWRIALLKKELDKIDFNINLVEVGQGFKDMTVAIEGMEKKLLNGSYRHGGHPVLTMCVANSSVETDATDNRKLNKKKSTGRIDGAVALAISEFVAEKPPEPDDNLDGFLNSPIVC